MLAFGNGAPDILASILDPDKDSEMLFTEIFGGSLFVLCVIGGLLAILKPFKVIPHSFIRDTLFLIVSIFTVLAFQADEFYIPKETIVTVTIYVIYMVVVLCGHFVQKSMKTKLKTKATSVIHIYKRNSSETATEIWNITSERPYCIDNIDLKLKLELKLNANIGNTSTSVSETDVTNHCQLWIKSFKKYLNDKFVVELKKNLKAYSIFKIINELMLDLVIPQYDLTVDKHGWNKLLNMIHLFSMPQILSIIALGEIKPT